MSPRPFGRAVLKDRFVMCMIYSKIHLKAALP
jgi:hypothetical protein